ncbi:hypothetical protein Nmel_003705 [Mimus melanotis]
MGAVVQELHLRDCAFGSMGLWHLTSYCKNYLNTGRRENEWSCDGMEIRHKHTLSELVMQKCAPSVSILLLVHSQLHNMHITTICAYLA